MRAVASSVDGRIRFVDLNDHRAYANSNILLMLYLEAALLLLVAAGASAAAVDVVPGATDAIRLPTDLRGEATCGCRRHVLQYFWCNRVA